MFDKKEKRYFIVISKCMVFRDDNHYKTIELAREAALKQADFYKGKEFLVCGVDSSYIDKSVTSTHYY
tara:strand:- start:4519 stop:4722 length:204 start_codon:yes stop_codon:yes gene_type:complete